MTELDKLEKVLFAVFVVVANVFVVISTGWAFLTGFWSFLASAIPFLSLVTLSSFLAFAILEDYVSSKRHVTPSY